MNIILKFWVCCRDSQTLDSKRAAGYRQRYVHVENAWYEACGNAPLPPICSFVLHVLGWGHQIIDMLLEKIPELVGEEETATEGGRAPERTFSWQVGLWVCKVKHRRRCFCGVPGLCWARFSRRFCR